ncbi:hypothetical protein Q7M76_05230 [Candidatus Liberibacter asiaticus]|uniref:Uncharacterized protein n=2 Tax=Liberibacter asiaticus TaxID=34021 RepID=C6XGY4_LIBAP|nr:hypothetical protein [Candidatus Liberibacter asiaticus]ACT57637.1 hypothetical protein CLIBASIA_05355 [Candidatus Liberibacter asiaticus str. psy62]AGH17398.1 hypothetical protein WSI_05205 [Candidatus Liberibacter asiaticus str. gxpsy]KAE9509691.1 hypothetical protein FXW22_05150 [Candidatus Liberibacter asiaticus]KAE9511547.1 hypothetical protein FXW31_00940 [Candidatus Liberibacter asiaticus]KAE9511774.1 hypothetical protein FXW32_05135 [Candidatus Liberibacter asiaticus]
MEHIFLEGYGFLSLRESDGRADFSDISEGIALLNIIYNTMKKPVLSFENDVHISVE